MVRCWWVALAAVLVAAPSTGAQEVPADDLAPEVQERYWLDQWPWCVLFPNGREALSRLSLSLDGDNVTAALDAILGQTNITGVVSAILFQWTAAPPPPLPDAPVSDTAVDLPSTPRHASVPPTTQRHLEAAEMQYAPAIQHIQVVANGGSVAASSAQAVDVDLFRALVLLGASTALVFTAVGILQALRAAWMLVATGFTKMSRQAVASHPARKTILDLLTDHPGMCTADIARTLDLHISTAAYHLRALQRYELVVAQPVGKALCYSLRDSDKDKEDAMAAVLLSKMEYLCLARHVLDHPEVNQKALAERFGWYPSRVHDRIKQLQEADLIEGVRRGRTVVYHATPRLHQHLGFP